jgi:ubiquinone/menaquinone biosynthesis C-methylase UbiE
MHLLHEHAGASVTGVDLSPDQIRAARRLAADEDAGARARLLVGAAEALPFADASFSSLYSVEAAQHFESFPSFVREAARVLAPDGRLGITTMFARDEAAMPALAALLPTVHAELDRIVPLGAAIAALASAGLREVASESIGAHVFPLFDRWIEQVLGAEVWGRKWLAAYADGLLDYVILSGRR